MNKEFLCTLVLIFSLNYAFSQNQIFINGKIIDASNKEPVSFATIYFSKGKGTIADEDGYFRLTGLRTTDSLTFSSIGFESKKVSVAGLHYNAFNTVYLKKQVIGLVEVTVKAKRKRLNPLKIINKALEKIERNYTYYPVLYHGYYREYLKQNGQYCNLIETIMNIEDPGFGLADDFKAQILFKRQNTDFEINESLMIAYDNKALKKVPNAIMPRLNNELKILRIHDPIRRYDQFTFSYVNVLQEDFIRNHLFAKPQIVYFDEKPIYSIQFKSLSSSGHYSGSIKTKGEIFIDAKNFGIHKIVYTAYANDGTFNTKLYELDLNYKQVLDKYYLNYISFNNRLEVENPEETFCIRETIVDTTRKAVQLKLSQNIDIYKRNPEHPGRYTIKYHGKQFHPGRVLVKDSIVQLFSMELINLLDTISDVSVNNLSVEIRNIYDVKGNEINKRVFETFFQYREFFVKETYTEFEPLSRTTTMDCRMPVMKNPQIVKNYSDTTWINTPLINADM